jgi:hypothetical protein
MIERLVLYCGVLPSAYVIESGRLGVLFCIQTRLSVSVLVFLPCNLSPFKN